jgi:cytochrome c oxidase accessory protein FixG
MASTTLINTAKELSTPTGGEPPRHEDLYAKRKQIYPKLVHGKFRTVKWLVMAITLGVYYGLPWVRWNRGEGIPDQAVLADFSSEKFYFFFIELWPQDIHYMAGGLILAALLLFLVTSLLGRVWCGYTCPQTVWTDLYIWVERAFEGDRAARMRLDKAPMSANKLARKLGKHIVWLIIAFWTGGAFILYWHDAPTVASGWLTGDAPLTAYWFAGILTLTTYFLAGTMREQVCTYMCPWPRIQGALTDEQALNVTYRYDRGEPRGPKRKSESWENRGDCIDCNQCVQVCPMGIDIRDGEQLECIHCALCIDACDEIMVKVDRPKGLIAYDTQVAVAMRNEGLTPPKHRLIRARTVVYAVVMIAIAGLMSWGLATKSTLEANILKDRSPPFVTLSDGRIQNGYTLKLVNKASEPRTMLLHVSGLDGMSFKVIGMEHEGSGPLELPVEAFGVDRYRILVAAEAGAPRRQVVFTVRDEDTAESDVNVSSFRGAEQ